MLFYYWGVSVEENKKKWKLRLIKTKYIEPEGAARHDWIAFLQNGHQKAELLLVPLQRNGI